ncbi:MAG: hypothetical protein SGILL_008590 [Bacillariaceae sp.]
MGYLSSGASVSSVYSANSSRVRFKSSQEALAAALDNKYLKRRSQIEDYQRQHHLDLCDCGEQMFHLARSPRNRQYLMVLIVVMFFSLSSFWFLAGWLSALYSTPVSEEKSLQDLADSIRRMRLRRHNTNKKAAVSSQSEEDDDVTFRARERRPEDDLRDQNNVHQYYDSKHPPEPKNEFEYQGEAARVQALEQRIRETQDRQVKAELRAKRLEDSMANNIHALKDIADHGGPNLASDELEEESFT